MASSPIDLANSALLKVGARRINSFNDQKVEATTVNEFYERSIRFLFSLHYWGFAAKAEVLALLPDKPVAEYAYAYALPEDMLRVQRVFPNTNYKIVGNELHCNERSITLKYTRRVPEEDLPVYFEQTFMYYLASQITVTLTENTTKDANNYAEYTDHLKRAKGLDSQQYPQDGFEDFPLENARYGS